MNVVLTGIFYPMAILRYFEAALKRRPDVSLFSAGPWTGAWIPWNYGMNLPAKYATPPDLPLPRSAAQHSFPVAFVEAKLPWVPDLWLQIDAGWHLRGRPRRGRNAVVGTDPHVLDYGEARGYADTFYCMQACYGQGDDRYLPYACDPLWHAPETQPRRHDACLLGLHYEQRDQWVAALRARGMDVYYDLGPVFDEARALYNQAPIGLNWSSLKDLNARVFELLGMRRLAVVNRVPDLATFFQDGRDLVVFDSLHEAVDKTLYYHTHPDEAAAIARQGHAAVAPHTWDARVAQILEGACAA